MTHAGSMRHVVVSLTILVLLTGLTGCSRPQPQPQPQPQTGLPVEQREPSGMTGPETDTERLIRQAIASDVPSITAVYHSYVEGTHYGADGDMGEHAVNVTSCSTAITYEQCLGALLKLNVLFDDVSSVYLLVAYPAEDGTGLAQGYVWERPFSRIRRLKARAELPAVDAFYEIGSDASAERIDAAILKDSLAGKGDIPWEESPK